jgi:SAM-dependent methyltransferase
MGATTVPGVWVAGNVADAMAQVVMAAGAGLEVGALVNFDLINEDTDAAVAAHRADQEEFFESPGWERRYAAADPVWSGKVNPQLAAEASDLTPGRALDIGSGEGADAIWLASRGWSVTGLDFSRVALEKAATHAARAGVAERTDWRQVDVRTFDPASEPAGERWELVTSQFMHLPDGGMVDLTRRLGGAVALGGTLLVVGHHPDDHATGLRQGRHSFLFTPEDLMPALDPDVWEIEVAEVRSRTVTHDGRPMTVGDSVVRARRRA